ncbi:MAG: polyprenyl synthetase family protein [Pirellulaceae bacterium]
MDTQTTLPESATSSFSTRTDSIYDCIVEPMHQVERMLRDQMQSKYEDLAPLLAHGALLGGKRLRPALVLLSGMATGSITTEHIVVGTVVEMVHTATLIHDDVLDSAQHRRHMPTVNAKWNNQTSILLGDYLFSQAFTLSASLGSTLACRWIGEAARLVCEGELRQIMTQGLMRLGEEDYLDIIRGKTAELCRVSCRLGAAYSNADETTQQTLASYGENLGIAFQIADDYLDLWGSAERVGKTLGTDLDQAKPTLPLIRLLETDPLMEDQIETILSLEADQRFQAIMQRLERSDAKQYTLETARRFATNAIDAIESLPSSDAKQTLCDIAMFSVNRGF